jgi:hypothetical protein
VESKKPTPTGPLLHPLLLLASYFLPQTLYFCWPPTPLPLLFFLPLLTHRHSSSPCSARLRWPYSGVPRCRRPCSGVPWPARRPPPTTAALSRRYLAGATFLDARGCPVRHERISPSRHLPASGSRRSGVCTAHLPAATVPLPLLGAPSALPARPLPLPAAGPLTLLGVGGDVAPGIAARVGTRLRCDSPPPATLAVLPRGWMRRKGMTCGSCASLTALMNLGGLV